MRWSVGIMAAGVLLAGAARAQPVQGLYMSGGFGAGISPSERVPAAHDGFAPAPVPGSASVAPEPVGQGSVGYGFGNGFRVEAEGTHASNRFRLGAPP